MTDVPTPPLAKRDRSPAALLYARGQVLPRLPHLICDKAFAAAIVVGIGAPIAIDHSPGADIGIAQIGSILIDYSAVGLAACITALVLAIGLAPAARIEAWSNTYSVGKKFSSYSELVFVLSWSAFAHLATVMVGMCAVLAGGDAPVVPEDPKTSHWILLGCSAAIVLYAVWQLAAVISTLSMIGAVTVVEANKDLL